MALRTDPRLYTGGAVVMPQPSLNLYAQILARQQAKAEAMDQYERSRINSVNDAGVRDIDRKPLDDKLGELRSFYQANKVNIQRGNSKEAFDYEKMFRGIRDFIAQSKDRAARHNAALQFYNERLKQDQRLPDGFMLDLHSNDMPLGEKYMTPEGTYEEYKPFDIAKWASQPKPFSADKYLQEYKDIKRTTGTPTYSKTTDPYTQLQSITQTFDNDAKQVIAARAATKYDNSYSFSEEVKNNVQDPIRRKELSDVFQKEYGLQPSSMSDYATAYTIEKLQPSIIQSKPVQNREAIAELNDRLARGRIAMRAAFTRQNIDYRTAKELQNIIASDENFDKVWKTIGTNLDESVVKKVFGSPVDEKGHKLPPPTITLSPDGQTYHFTIYSNGEPDPTYSKDISAANVKTQMKQLVKDAIKTRTNLPPKTEAKKEIKRSDIKLKATAAGYSEKEYEDLLKQKGVKIIE